MVSSFYLLMNQKAINVSQSQDQSEWLSFYTKAYGSVSLKSVINWKRAQPSALYIEVCFAPQWRSLTLRGGRAARTRLLEKTNKKKKKLSQKNRSNYSEKQICSQFTIFIVFSVSELEGDNYAHL